MQHHRDGTGTITFLGIVESAFDEDVIRLKFEAIWDEDRVVTLARQVAHQAGHDRPKPTLRRIVGRAFGQAVTMVLAAVVATAILGGTGWIIGRGLPPGNGDSALFPVHLTEPAVLLHALGLALTGSFLFFWSRQAEDATRRSSDLQGLAVPIVALKWASVASAVASMWWLAALVRRL